MEHQQALQRWIISGISAIPEPGTYAALAGLFALGLAAWRRRRSAQRRTGGIAPLYPNYNYPAGGDPAPAPIQLPSLSGGLAWNTSSLYSDGVISVVSAIPEPSTYAALAGLRALGVAAWRRRRQ